jgi:hypothetical protein
VALFLLSFYSSEHAAHMAHWPVKTKPQRVFTGLWKRCARMLRRIVIDETIDPAIDAKQPF